MATKVIIQLECDECGEFTPVEYDLDPYGPSYFRCIHCDENIKVYDDEMHAAFVRDNECDCEVCRKNAQMEIHTDLRRGL